MSQSAEDLARTELSGVRAGLLRVNGAPATDAQARRQASAGLAAVAEECWRLGLPHTGRLHDDVAELVRAGLV